MVVEVGVVICLALMIISFLLFLRGQMVYLLQSRLLNEESIWLQRHRDEIGEGQLLFARYLRLPSYTAMTLKFWKTMGSFERAVGAIEQYYPLLKVQGNF